MTTLESLKPTTERLKIVQTQLRKAIQNHHLLLQKHQVQPSDQEIKNHINALQACIITMGRSQNELLAQLRKELDCTEFDLNSAVTKYLIWPDTPKHIPIFKQTDLANENKKIATWKRRRGPSFVRIQPKRHSILKAKVESLEHCDTEISLLKGNISNKKSSPSSSETLSDDTDCAEIIPIKTSSCNLKCPIPSLKNNQKFGPKILTKARFRCVSSGSANFSKKDIRSDSELIKDKKNRPDLILSSTKNDQCSLSSSPQGVSSEDSQTNWVSMGESGQDIFLGYLGLVSKAQFDVLKRKRCERKRRSVAGQSSMYNDYFQPPTPKRTYAPRKTSVAVPPNQVVVEIAAEVEDEDEKPLKTEQNCSICNLSGILEVCHSCSDTYHSKCITNPSNGCPTCNAQPSNIKNIVGANSVSSASSMELIKRYLAPSSNNETDVPEVAQTIIDEET